MRKKMLLIVLALLLAGPVEANWRHHLYFIDGIFGLFHPSGDWWPWQCEINNGGQNVCQFKK